VALQLKRRGIHRVRPLEGGFEAWLALGYPVSGGSGSSESEELERAATADPES
jgi:3-mercaptopyruvate sulfurtransferase SseA